MDGVTVTLEKDSASNRQLLEVLTARLPQWFAQADSNRHYAEQAEILEGWVAWISGEPTGLLLLKRHGPASAEIYWLGVAPEHHRRGIGQVLVRTVERQLKGEKARHLFVMTLHPDVDYEPYQRTRAFYEALGFDFVLTDGQRPIGPSRDPLAWYLKLL
jgi:ribosomal protein S18 acetylase RimI-like enzyme